MPNFFLVLDFVFFFCFFWGGVGGGGRGLPEVADLKYSSAIFFLIVPSPTPTLCRLSTARIMTDFT